MNSRSRSPAKALGLGVTARNTPLSSWDIQAMKSFEEYIDPIKQAWLAEVRYSPDGILGPNNVRMLTQSPVKPISDEGKDLWAVYQERRVEGSALITQIIAGWHVGVPAVASGRRRPARTQFKEFHNPQLGLVTPRRE